MRYGEGRSDWAVSGDGGMQIAASQVFHRCFIVAIECHREYINQKCLLAR